MVVSVVPSQPVDLLDMAYILTWGMRRMPLQLQDTQSKWVHEYKDGSIDYEGSVVQCGSGCATYNAQNLEICISCTEKYSYPMAILRSAVRAV